MKSTLALILAAAFTLGGCATFPDQHGPVSVVGEPDTAVFKLYARMGVPDSAADADARKQFDSYASAKGYRSYTVVDRRWNYAPTYFEYTVKFSTAGERDSFSAK